MVAVTEPTSHKKPRFAQICFTMCSSLYIPLYPIISRYIPLYPIISHYIPLYPIISRYIPLYPIISHYIPLYPIIHIIISYYIPISPYITPMGSRSLSPPTEFGPRIVHMTLRDVSENRVELRNLPLFTLWS